MELELDPAHWAGVRALAVHELLDGYILNGCAFVAIERAQSWATQVLRERLRSEP